MRPAYLTKSWDRGEAGLHLKLTPYASFDASGWVRWLTPESSVRTCVSVCLRVRRISRLHGRGSVTQELAGGRVSQALEIGPDGSIDLAFVERPHRRHNQVHTLDGFAKHLAECLLRSREIIVLRWLGK